MQITQALINGNTQLILKQLEKTLMQRNPRAALWSWHNPSEEQEWGDAVYLPQCCHCACCACPCGRGHRSRCTPWRRRRAGRPWSPACSQGPCARSPPARETTYRPWALRGWVCNPRATSSFVAQSRQPGRLSDSCFPMKHVTFVAVCQRDNQVSHNQNVLATKDIVFTVLSRSIFHI